MALKAVDTTTKYFGKNSRLGATGTGCSVVVALAALMDNKKAIFSF